jgi:hypothetical protein
LSLQRRLEFGPTDDVGPLMKHVHIEPTNNNPLGIRMRSQSALTELREENRRLREIVVSLTTIVLKHFGSLPSQTDGSSAPKETR